MKIFADQHHDALWYSLQLLFEKRLGFELYRPIGLEWYHEGYWHIWNHIDTARQYLDLNQKIDWPKDIHGNKLHPQQCLNLNYRHEDGIYYVEDIPRKVYQRAVTLPKFKEMQFDIVISSIPNHVGPFNNIIQQFQPKAKHIMQLGNNWPASSFPVKNLLSSALKINPRPDQNVVYYHQEFPLDQYTREPCPNPKSVINMMHHIPSHPKALFLETEKSMPDWKWYMHGACNRDDAVLTEKIPQRFKDTGFLWHVKQEGGGYEYNIHHAAACGRPIITKRHHFAQMTADPLFIDDISCVNLDKYSIGELPKVLNSMAARHEEISVATRKRFDEVVNFDEEEHKIRKFIESLH